MSNQDLNELINVNNLGINYLEAGKFNFFLIFFYIGILGLIIHNLQRQERLLFHIYTNLVNNGLIPQAPEFPLPQVPNPHHQPHPHPHGGNPH